MEIKIVNQPLQGEKTKPKKQYPNETWCVRTEMFREGDGGMKLFFNKLEKLQPDVVYLYDIKASKEKIVNGPNENDWFEDIFYFVRFDMKKIKNI